jgi:biotin transport system substrate-specific component
MITKATIIPKYLSEIVTSKLFGIISFTILTAVAAQFTIPVKPVPFTLQTVMVVLAGAFLGARYGAYSQLLYLLAGCLGLPVFAQVPDASFGFMKLFGPTGGYLLSFPIAAFITGYLVEKNKGYFFVTLSMLIANIFILLMGTLFLNTFYIKNIYESLKYGAAVFSIWTVVKLFLTVNIYYFTKKPRNTV